MERSHAIYKCHLQNFHPDSFYSVVLSGLSFSFHFVLQHQNVRSGCVHFWSSLPSHPVLYFGRMENIKCPVILKLFIKGSNLSKSNCKLPKRQWQVRDTLTLKTGRVRPHSLLCTLFRSYEKNVVIGWHGVSYSITQAIETRLFRQRVLVSILTSLYSLYPSMVS